MPVADVVVQHRDAVRREYRVEAEGEDPLKPLDHRRALPGCDVDQVVVRRLPAGQRRLQPPVPAAIVVAEHVLPERLGSEEHTAELTSLMRIPYAVYCWKTKK